MADVATEENVQRMVDNGTISEGDKQTLDSFLKQNNGFFMAGKNGVWVTLIGDDGEDRAEVGPTEDGNYQLNVLEDETLESGEFDSLQDALLDLCQQAN